jgi:hypothetical protein
MSSGLLRRVMFHDGQPQRGRRGSRWGRQWGVPFALKPPIFDVVNGRIAAISFVC